MNSLLDYKLLIPLVLLLGFAPFFPQPHIVEKIRMLMAGTPAPADRYLRSVLACLAVCPACLPHRARHKKVIKIISIWLILRRQRDAVQGLVEKEKIKNATGSH